MLKLRNILKCSTVLMATGFAIPAIAQNTSDGGAVAQDSSESIIVVTGTRSSVANSIEAKRNEEAISDVLSADTADRFPDNNIAESLARVPGVSFQRNNDSSDGAFISIRGLDATFVTVQNDGLRTGTASSFRRTPLDLVQGDGISNITITKAPLPEHASEGLGGIVDIRTKGALEKSERISLSARIDDNSYDNRNGYRFSGSFTKHLTDNLGISLSGSYRKRYFDTLQIDASGGLRFLTPQTFTGANGTMVTLGGTGSSGENFSDEVDLVPEGFVGIENFTVEQVNYDNSVSDEDLFSLSGTLDWEVSGATTLTLGGRLSHEKSKNVISRIEFDTDRDRFEARGCGLSVPDLTGCTLGRTFDDPEISFRGFLNDEKDVQANVFLRGRTELDNWTFDYIAGYSYAKRNRPELLINYTQEYDSIPGGSSDEEITFAPFIANGVFLSPLRRDGALGDAFDLGLNPFCDDGGGPGSCGEVADFEEELEDSLKNERYSARIDVKRDFDNDGPLQYLKFGLQYERSNFTDTLNIASFFQNNLAPDGTFVTLENARNALGEFIDNDEVAGAYGLLAPGVIRDLGPIGGPGRVENFPGIPLFNGDALRALRQTHRDSFNAQGGVPWTVNVTNSAEDFYTGYVQGKFSFGDLDVIGGIRLEQYDARFRGKIDLATDVEFDPLDDGDDFDLRSTSPANAQNLSSNSNFVALPRIAFNYNVSDRFKVRAAYTTAIARPTFDVLAGEIDGDFDVVVNPGVSVAAARLADVDEVSVDFTLGNPNLKNAYSHNFDFSAEYYFDKQNAVSFAAFYKRIDNFIFSSFATPDGANFNAGDAGALFDSINFSGPGAQIIEQLGGFDALLATPNVEVDISQAQNGGKAEVYGVEFGVFHTFSYLPGFLKNFGFIGNLTLQKTSTDLVLGTLNAEDILVQIGDRNVGDTFTQKLSFFNSPEVIGNAALFYEGNGIDATLSYRYSGIQLESVLSRGGINQYQQGRGFLDFDIDYTFKDVGPLKRLTIFASGNDILDTGRKFSVFESFGRSRTISDNATFNGRSFKFGARVRF